MASATKPGAHNKSDRPDSTTKSRPPSPPTAAAIDSARAAQLRYVTDTRPGFRRVRRGGGFVFRDENKKAVSAADRKRIQNLVIPPAWEDVWICPYENGHLQATGRDDRGRKQYLYHSDWHAVRSETKFHQLIEFGMALPKIRRRVARDLKLKGLPRNKVLAAVVRLLETTQIRVGNPEYARSNDSFGLSTMRDRHVRVRGHKVKFRFRGKSGKDHEIELIDPRLAGIVKRCQDLPGYDLFQYVDDQNEVCNATSGDVNEYLKEISGQEFTAKHYRTWAGTIHAARILAACATTPTKKDLLACIDSVAEKLGNTRAVCRKYYIHPAVVEAAGRSELVSMLTTNQPHRAPRTGLSVGEKAVLRLLKLARRKAKRPMLTALKLSVERARKKKAKHA